MEFEFWMWIYGIRNVGFLISRFGFGILDYEFSFRFLISGSCFLGCWMCGGKTFELDFNIRFEISNLGVWISNSRLWIVDIEFIFFDFEV